MVIDDRLMMLIEATLREKRAELRELRGMIARLNYEIGCLEYNMANPELVEDVEMLDSEGFDLVSTEGVWFD